MYTLLKTTSIEESMDGDYFTHCYSESDILVRGRCVITNNQDSVGQLQNSSQFEIIDIFNTKEEAELVRDIFIKTGYFNENDIPIQEGVNFPVEDEIISVLPEEPNIKLHKILQNNESHTDKIEFPWYGSNLKLVRK